MKRVLLGLALLPLLAGCWTGEPWFTPSDAVAALPDGNYRLTEADSADGEIVQITRQPDGALQIAGPEGPLYRAIPVPLNPGMADDRYIVQFESVMPGSQAALYLLLDGSNGRYRASIMSCSGDVAEAVGHSGGTVTRDPQTAASCHFDERDTLVSWLRTRAQDESFDIELERVGEPGF
jgi:hypothetical protein